MAKEIGRSTKTSFLTLMSKFDYDNGVGEAYLLYASLHAKKQHVTGGICTCYAPKTEFRPNFEISA